MKTPVAFLKDFFQNLVTALIPAILVVYFLGGILIKVAKDMLLNQITFVPDRNIPVNFNSNIDILVFAGLSVLVVILIITKTSREFEKPV